MESSLIYIIIATLTLVTIVALILCIVIYYALDARRQGFDVMKRQIDYFSLVTFIDDKNVTFTPHGDDTKQYSIPILGIEGRNGKALEYEQIYLFMNLTQKPHLDLTMKRSNLILNWVNWMPGSCHKNLTIGQYLYMVTDQTEEKA